MVHRVSQRTMRSRAFRSSADLKKIRGLLAREGGLLVVEICGVYGRVRIRSKVVVVGSGDSERVFHPSIFLSMYEKVNISMFDVILTGV